MGFMSVISRAYPLFPSHDPVVGYFLGKMMKPKEEGAMPAVMMKGTVDGADFVASTLWNEDGLEIEGGVSANGKTEDLLSNMSPKLFIDPTGGFWGAAREMPVRSVMQVKESLGDTSLSGTHSESVLQEDAAGETSKFETHLQGQGARLDHSLTLQREKKYVPLADGFMLIPKGGEVSLSSEADGVKVNTPSPLSLSVDPDGTWNVSGEMEVNQQKQHVESTYRLLKMPFIGVPYVQVDSKAGQSEAHYFIAPLPGLVQLSGIISHLLTRQSGKQVIVPPAEALDEAKKHPNLRLSGAEMMMQGPMAFRPFLVSGERPKQPAPPEKS